MGGLTVIALPFFWCYIYAVCDGFFINTRAYAIMNQDNVLISIQFSALFMPW